MVLIPGYMHDAISIRITAKMYRVIFPYNNKDPGFVTIQIGDVFNLIDQIDDNWWSVHDEKGNHGLVPASYLEVNDISEEEVLKSIAKSIESIQKFSAKGKGALNEEQQSILEKLVKHRQMISQGTSLWSKRSHDIPQQPKRQAPKAPVDRGRKGKSTKRYSAPPPPDTDKGVLQRSMSVDYANVNASSATPDRGVSSNIYNIAVNNGNISHPPVNEISPLAKSKESSLKDYFVFVESSADSKKGARDSPDSTLPRTSSDSRVDTLQEVRGKNFTIKKTSGTEGNFVGGLSATNFVVSRNKTKLKDLNRSQSCYVKTDNTLKPVLQSSISLKSNDTNTNIYHSDSSLNSSSTSGISSAPSPMISSSSVEAISEISATSSLQSSPSSNASSGRSNVPISRAHSSSAIPNTILNNTTVPENLGKNLIDKVRSRCKLNFNKSLDAVRILLHTIGGEIPDAKGLMDKIQEQIVDDNLSDRLGLLALEDSALLHSILERLTEHKQDSQQRNWSVHEDFETIKDLLDDLITTLGEIDPSVSRSVLQEDEYRYLNDLIVFYQMESRSKLRILLMHAFGCFCELGAEFVTELLCSVLPTELSLDLMQNQKDIQRFVMTCTMLTMVFSTGEQVPYNHYVQFNEAFIDFVLDTVENPPNNDVNDRVPDALIAVLLAFNQHFKSPKHNVVMQCIAKRKTFRTLSEKVLLLVNKEKDPVAMFSYVKSCPDSIMKFLIDLFASKSTSGMFFTNDLMVLIEIILRQISDRPVKDKVRTEYLSLFHSLLNTTDYGEHRHHAASFKRCFQDILLNSEYESEVDLYIVKEVTKRFGDLFE